MIIPFLVGLIVGWHLRERRALPPFAFPSATATVAQALAGNEEALQRVADVRAAAARGDVAAIGYVADLGAAYAMVELHSHIVDTEVVLDEEAKAA